MNGPIVHFQVIANEAGRPCYEYILSSRGELWVRAYDVSLQLWGTWGLCSTPPIEQLQPTGPR